MSGTQRSSLGHRGSSVMGSHLAPKEKLLPWTPLNPTWTSEVLPLASSHLCIRSEFEGAACMYRRMVSISHQVVQSSLVAMGNSLHLQGAPPAGKGMLLWSSLQSQMLNNISDKIFFPTRQISLAASPTFCIQLVRTNCEVLGSRDTEWFGYSTVSFPLHIFHHLFLSPNSLLYLSSRSSSTLSKGPERSFEGNWQVITGWCPLQHWPAISTPGPFFLERASQERCGDGFRASCSP